MNHLGYSLILSNEDGDEIDLYDDPDLAITSTDGFGTNVEVNTSTIAGQDGATYQSTFVPARDISITVQYLFDGGDPELAKIRLHNILKIRQRIKIHYISPNRNAWIYGYVKTVDTPENTYPMQTTISFVCPDPYWTSGDAEEKTVNFSGNTATIDYNGDVPAGFITTIKFASNFKGIDLAITHDGVTKHFYSDGNYASYNEEQQSGFSSGSALVINSKTGEKGIVYHSDGDVTKRGRDYFATTAVGYLYPQLKKGKNTITVTAGTEARTYTSDTGFTVSIKYSEKSVGGM